MNQAAGNRRLPVARTSVRHVEWVRERLSARDWAILADLDRLRVLSADHLERLHFSPLTGHSREVVRGRVLRRLVSWGVIVPLERRVGGSRRGSARTLYVLDTTGQRLMRERHAAERPMARIRRPGVVGERFLAHTLAVSELYVLLTTEGLSAGMKLVAFEAEPAAWWPDGLGGWLKPDAYLVLDSRASRWHFWAEIDRATESLPTVTRKLETYLDFYQRGQLGPSGLMPRVLVSTVTEQRREAIHVLIHYLPEPANRLFVTALDRNTMLALLSSLKE